MSQLASDRMGIDLGLTRLRQAVQDLPKAIEDYHANAVWKDLDKKYSAAIEQPIIKDPSTSQGAGAVLKYPLRSQIFVPQSFKVLRYSAGLHLEDSRTWATIPVRKDIGEFLLAYLASDYSSTAPLVILGHPGSGKSLLSQMLAAQTMSNAYAPIRLELRSINADNEIEAQIEEQIRKDIARTVSFSTLVDGLKGRPAVVIFDGYDELLQATGQVFAGYLTKVQKFQEREAQTLGRNNVRSIVTSRVTLIDKAVVPEGTTVLRLLEFDEEQKKKWISVWNKTNLGYFSAAGIKAFSLPTSAKLAPIAEQPLLLLMLALYDSKSNQLNEAKGLDQTLLYESLLKRFIDRERTKDPGFEETADDKRKESEIATDLERLGVTAIGMFNRQALHIRATQLNADLEFFKLTRQVPSGSGRPLSQAELVLGGFFFVHQSTAQQRGDAGEDREADASFEFLHNTFGEYLTGHFLTTQVLRETNNLYKLRVDPDLADYRTKVLNDRDGLGPTWYASLMYAPLFPRPVIVALLREWFGHPLNRTQRKREDVLKDLDDIIFREIRRVVTGRDFPSVMVSQDTSITALPLFGALATYTLNLLILRVAIGDTTFVFNEKKFDSMDRGPRVWDKLANLWKSWFTIDELSALTLIFSSERTGELITIKRANDHYSGVVGRRAETYANVARALGDNVGIALSGALLSESLEEQSASLARAQKASATENLGIDDELLLRDILNAARTRVDDDERKAIFERCMKSIEGNSVVELGRSIDIVRAYGVVGEPTLHRSLAFHLVYVIYAHRIRLNDPANAESAAALLDLLGVADARHSHPFPEMMNEGLEHGFDGVNALSDLPANVALSILRWSIVHRRELPETVTEPLTRRIRDRQYVSRLSPYIAAGILRLATRAKPTQYDELFLAVLADFLQPSQLINMKSEVAISILHSAQRPCFRSLLRQFCDDLAESLGERETNEIRWRLSRFQLRYRDDKWIEPLDLAITLLQIMAKFGGQAAKEKFYRFALERWFRQGRLKLSLAILEFARRFDDGELLMQFVKSDGRGTIIQNQLNFRMNTRVLFHRSDLRTLSLSDIEVLEWFAVKSEDAEGLERMLGLRRDFADSAIPPVSFT